VDSEDAPTILTDGSDEDWGPAWSPDGRKIAFRRKGGEPGIYWVSLAGGAENFVAPIARQDQETLPQLSWSRDGKWIAAPDRDSSGYTHINLLSVSSGEKRELTSNRTGIDHAPAFSPDGKSLAFASCRSGVSPCDIYILDLGRGLQSRQLRRITDQGIYVRGIAWAPDGRSLVYSAGRNRSQDTYLWRVATDPPGLPERIDLAGSRARHPAVSASSNLLAYTGLNNWKLMMIQNFR
jgi:TolB protein